MAMNSSNIQITASPEYMRYGLFGQVLLYIFRILPYLEKNDILPDWRIGSKLYGGDPDRIIIPGLFNLSYTPPSVIRRKVNLEELFKWKQYYLGSDYTELSRLWKRYFSVPQYIESSADKVGCLSETLGVHYRGNEKLTSTWDSNFISQDDFLDIVVDCLSQRPHIRSVLIATDDTGFKERARARLELPVIEREPGRFMFEEKSSAERMLEAEKALLDCVLLSRCGVVMSTSSALSAFSKILNPDLDIYRTAASKLFEDAPYFPVAYIPIYHSENPAIAAILEKTMEGDWTKSSQASKFKAKFAYRRRSIFSHIYFRILGRLGLQPVQIWMRAHK
jgi:hypothetical protein